MVFRDGVLVDERAAGAHNDARGDAGGAGVAGGAGASHADATAPDARTRA
jgi:hypothetical protein